MPITPLYHDSGTTIVPLLLDTGGGVLAPAVDAAPCACCDVIPDDCCCQSGLPTTLSVSVENLAEGFGTAPCCEALNGSWVCEYQEPQCLWLYTEESECGGDLTVSVSISGSPPDECFVSVSAVYVDGAFEYGIRATGTVDEVTCAGTIDGNLCPQSGGAPACNCSAATISVSL